VTRERLLERVSPVLALISTLDPDDVPASESALRSLPIGGLSEALLEAHSEGWLTPKEGGGVRFGRLAKASSETLGYTIDVVEMEGPARRPGVDGSAGLSAHTHLTGEFDLCLPLSGAPAFDGRSDRWVVYPCGSRHVPTVTGGRMLIAYFVKDGAIRFE
jgi:hypothetical protein